MNVSDVAMQVRVSSDTLRRILSGSKQCSYALAQRLKNVGIDIIEIQNAKRMESPQADLPENRKISATSASRSGKVGSDCRQSRSQASRPKKAGTNKNTP